MTADLTVTVSGATRDAVALAQKWADDNPDDFTQFARLALKLVADDLKRGSNTVELPPTFGNTRVPSPVTPVPGPKVSCLVDHGGSPCPGYP